MIIKKTQGQSFRKLFAYLLNDKKKGITERATIIGGNVLGNTPRELSKQFSYAWDKKPAQKKYRNYTLKDGSKEKREVVFKPVKHFSINPSDEDRALSDQEYEDIAKRFLKELGYGNCSFVLVKHKDENIEGKTHIHIATSQYDLTGKRVNEHNDVDNFIKFERKIEKEFGLIQVSSKAENSFENAGKLNTDLPAYDKYKKNKKKLVSHKKYNLQENNKNPNKLPFAQFKYKQLYSNVNHNVQYLRKYEPNKIVVRLKNKDVINDNGLNLSLASKGEINKNSISTLVQMAKSKGMQKVVVSGNKEFLLESWKQLEKKGIKVSVQDGQQELYRKYTKEKHKLQTKSMPTPEPAIKAKAEKPENEYISLKQLWELSEEQQQEYLNNASEKVIEKLVLEKKIFEQREAEPSPVRSRGLRM